ncbi:MAG: GNAT family N-acetyltransferase [Leeuwenhoekiella sp.]
MITIKEMKSSKEMLEFVKYPFGLYKNEKNWVPSLISDELDTFSPEKNPVFKNAEARFFIAYQNQEAVGRVAAIINRIEINEQQKPKMRFGWFDTIDNVSVTEALMKKVEEIGRFHQLQWIEGPVGFSNMEKAGMLIKGFDYLNTMITWYNYPYYKNHFEALGFEKASEWVEFKIKIPKENTEKVIKFARIIKERYKLKIVHFTNTKEILPYVNDMFGLLNKTYNTLSTFVPIQQYQIDHYKEKYIPYIHPNYIKCIENEKGKLIAFAITMPSFSKALKKANGKLFPLGLYHLWKARKKNDTAAFYLIGIDPEFQGKGVTALIFQEMHELFTDNGIKQVETNPELEENKAIQQLWKNYDHQLHKRRRTYKRDIE